MTPSVSTPFLGRTHFSLFCVGNEVVDGDRFVAVRAGAAEPDAGHEYAAVVAALVGDLAPGAVVPLHEHMALEQTFMLEGSLEDSEGSVGAGDFVWRPGGNIHVAHAPNGAMFISVFNRPNRFFDGTKFFTADKERA